MEQCTCRCGGLPVGKGKQDLASPNTSWCGAPLGQYKGKPHGPHYCLICGSDLCGRCAKSNWVVRYGSGREPFSARLCCHCDKNEKQRQLPEDEKAYLTAGLEAEWAWVYQDELWANCGDTRGWGAGQGVRV